MSIETREWNVFLDERKQGNFDFAREGWLADFNDPINMLEMWTTKSGNNDCQFGKDPNAAAEEEAEEEETEEAAVEETTEETTEEATDAAAAEAADETAEEAGAEDAEAAEEAGEETGLAEAGAAAAGAVATAVAAGAEDAEAAVEEAVDEAEEAVEETVEAAEEAVEETKEAVEETVDEAKEAVEETVEAVEEAVTQNAEEAKNALNKTVKSAEEETEEAVEEAADEAEEAVEETAEEVEETAEEATEEAAEEATEAVEEAAEEVKEEAAEAVEEPKDEEKKDEETKEEAEEEEELDGDSLYPDGAGVALKPASYNEAAPDWTEYTDLIAQIKTETDAEKRVALMHQAEDILMGTGAVIPIYYYNDLYLQKTDVEGIYSNLFGFKFFQFATCPRDVLKVNLASEPAKVDPALNSSVDGACLDVNLFAGLYTYDADGNLQPDLADPANPYEVSDDGLVYTFHLLDGLKWSDGTDVTAKDFEYAWKRCADPKTAADYAYMFDCFALADDGTINVEATDDHTLVATLNAPCAYFLDLCAFPAYLPVPQAQVEAQSDWEINPGAWAAEAGFVTNGAYTVKEWKHEESMVFVKNPNYHKADQVSIEEIDFMLSADDTAIFAAYNSDDLDFADTVPTNEIANIKENEDFHVIDNLGTYYAAFNVNSPIFEGKTVEQAVAMRKAFSLLIDRQYIVDNVGQTEQKVATSFIPAGMADGNGGVFKANTDAYVFPMESSEGYYPVYEDGVEDEAIDCARKFLEIAGYKFDEDGTLSDETPINITYLTNDGTGHIAVAESMQQDFDTLGIKMSIETREWNVFLDERKQGNFDFAREGWLADFNDPINMLEMWTPQSGNNDCQFGKDPNAAAE